MDKTTKIILGIFIVIIVIGGLWYGVSKKSTQTETTTPSSETQEPIKIGAVLPLTGKNVEWGERTKRGIDLALEEINKDRKIIEVVYENFGENIDQAVSATHKFINVDKVQVLLCQLSDVCSAIAPIAQENNVALFGFSHTPGLTEVGDFIFNLRGESIRVGGYWQDENEQLSF